VLTARGLWKASPTLNGEGFEMLEVISYKDISKRGDLFLGQFRLRHQEFIERQSYSVRKLDGMEFDQYDTLASRYIIYSDDGKTVLGCSRLVPIEYGCMLAENFPDLVHDKSIFARARVWEGTRFCVDSRLSPERRRLISRHLAAAYISFGLKEGIGEIIGLMPTLILKSVFERAGIQLRMLGEPRAIGAHARVQAASLSIDPDQLERVRRVTGLDDALAPKDAREGCHVA
jgi:N-acyl-L-homoserine lactone synthetase